MAEGDSILVDTNVLSDIIHGDPDWQKWAAAKLEENAGRLVVNPIIYAELCYRAPSRAIADDILALLELRYLEIPRDALFLASKAFVKYRAAGGTRTAPLADFFIGAHAEASGFPILTRDTSRYQTYFPSVQLLCP